MPQEIYTTDSERRTALFAIIPNLHRAIKLREDFWELVIKDGDTFVSMNAHITTIKRWIPQEGLPKQWSRND